MVKLQELAEGLSLRGVYTLEHWIGDDAADTFFAARATDGDRVLVKLAPAAAPDSEQRLAVWERSRHLRHDHLLYLRDTGRAEVAGAGYIYAVFEDPDDVLASALEGGQLSQEETHDVAVAAVSALRYLHSQGLVHGAVDPRHIVAVGDAIKLGTDSLSEADTLEGHAEDVRQLGELIRTLRGSEPLGEELETIVLHTTEPDVHARWTLAEVAAALTLPVQSASVIAEPVVPEPEPEPEPEPVVAMPVLPPPRPRRVPEPASPVGFPKWIFAGVAIVLLAILGFNLRKKPEAAPTPQASQPVVQRAVPQPTTAASVPVPVASKPAPGAIWRVIAFTYGSHSLAAKKAKYVNEKWPEFHATVLAASDKRGYFWVALGGLMRKDEAAALQRKARAKGLPRDTYVQNFIE